MKTNPPKEGALTDNSAGTVTVTREVVRERGAEPAVIKRRFVHGILPHGLANPASFLRFIRFLKPRRGNNCSMFTKVLQNTLEKELPAQLQSQKKCVKSMPNWSVA